MSNKSNLVLWKNNLSIKNVKSKVKKIVRNIE